MSIICFIPARGGSKGIKNKNIYNISGKPLIYWVLKELTKVKFIDRIIVATDSSKIKSTVNSFGYTNVEIYNRLPQNAQDESPTIDVVMEYILKLNDNDKILLVQATSPLLERTNVEDLLKKMNSTVYDSAFSCVKFNRICWTKNGLPIEHDIKSRKRRQEDNYILVENGAMYYNSVKNIKKNRSLLSGKIYPYIMPQETFYELDEYEDIEKIESLLNKKNKPINIKAFFMDCDGVLTDGGMYYSEDGEKLKKFNTIDGLGIKLLKDNGIYTAIITGENTKFAKSRAKKLKIDCFCGIDDKLNFVKNLLKTKNFHIDEIAYIGDDLNDLNLLQAVGYSACPQNANNKIKNVVNYITKHKGGDGAVREVIDKILGNLYGK